MTKDLAPYYYKTSSVDSLLDTVASYFGHSLFEDSFFKDSFSVDITEKEDRINISAELPGVKKDDLSVEYSNGVLTIKAEKTEEEKTSGKVLRRERSYGMIQRSFTVGDIDSENIVANYKDGILFIVLKKVKEEFKKVSIS